MGNWLNWQSLLGGAIGGIASWFLTTFIAGPIRRFHQMRAETYERIQYYGNLATHQRGEALEADEAKRAAEAIDALRQLGVRIQSFAATEPTAMWLLRRWWGYKPMEAGRSLIGYANTIIISDGERATHRNNVLAALCIKQDCLLLYRKENPLGPLRGD